MLEYPDLRLGRLVAQGGEGRVFEVEGVGGTQLPGQWVFKQFHQARPAMQLERLVAYPSVPASPQVAARLASSSSWPVDVVLGAEAGTAAGVLLPRAPAELWLAHRDGARRLATLSYLAGDPDRVELAYGVHLPPPGAAQRVALVYALARLLEVWQPHGPVGGPAAAPDVPGPTVPTVVHGDLSAKNVLWSLSPAPRVYVLDCDGAQLAGAPTPRPLTPNWDDPALGPGEVAGPGSDRYSLALAFLRVVGAAHFPVQGRQRSSGLVSIDLELPRSWRRYPDMPWLWELCERSLSVANAADRPGPWEWAQALGELLAVMGATDLATQVRQAQDGLGPAAPAVALVPSAAPDVLVGRAPRAAVPDVVVRPVLRDRGPSTWQLVTTRSPLGLAGPSTAGLGAGLANRATAGNAYAAPLTVRQVTRQALSMWARAHRLAVRAMRSPGRRSYGLRRAAGMAVLDLVAASVGLFLVGMVVSPWIGL